MTYEQALTYLHHLPRGNRSSSVRLEDRRGFRLLLQRLGNPQKRIKWIHFAGTNGKGSTAAFCYQILCCAGYRCGMFVSPYVSDFRERFQFAGQMIDKETLAALTFQLKQVLDPILVSGEIVTEFEAVTALGFLWFDGRAEMVCLETGIGGKNDATNIIPAPLAAVITSISFDHTAILGNKLEQIAAEKAGILKPGSICICNPKIPVDALAVLMERCAQIGTVLHQPNVGNVQIVQSDLSGSRFIYRGEMYCISLSGEHQIWNAVTAIELIDALSQCGFSVTPLAVKQGLAQAWMPARFELLHQRPDFIVDGAHNLEGFAGVAKLLAAKPAAHKIALVGMMKDKDYTQALEQLCSQVDELVCLQMDLPRALPCEELAEAAKPYLSAVRAETDWKKAILQSVNSLDVNGIAVVCGSFFLAGEVRSWILKQRPFSAEATSDEMI